MSHSEKIQTRSQAKLQAPEITTDVQSEESASSGEEDFHDTVPNMAAATPTFTIEYFDEQKNTFERWLKRLEGAFKIFNVSDVAVRVSYLLHFIGSETYNLVCDVVLPQTPEEMSYNDIAKVLKNHYNPEPLEIAEIYKFQSRQQQQGEPVRDYVTALRKMSTHCNFGDYLQKALRNQLVCGLRNRDVKRKLLGTKELDFEKALEIAYSFEATEEKSAEMTSQNINEIERTPREINQVRTSSSNKNFRNLSNPTTEGTSGVKCFRCAGQHLANVCKHINSICSYCNIKGHLSIACRKRKRSAIPNSVHATSNYNLSWKMK